MESSINSSCCCESPTVSGEGSSLKRRIEEENKEKNIMVTDPADAGMGKPQSLPSSPSFPADATKMLLKPWFPREHLSRRYFNLLASQARTRRPKLPPFRYQKQIKRLLKYRVGGLECNDDTFGSPKERSETLDEVMKALADPNTHIIGFHCSNENAIKVTVTLLEKVTRRANRDNMFDVIPKATVTKKPNIKKIQDEIAAGLNLKLDSKSIVKRASILHDNIKMKPKILVILNKLYKDIDLEKVGIPYGVDHSGCKILLVSTSEDVLSNQMHTQKNFPV